MRNFRELKLMMPDDGNSGGGTGTIDDPIILPEVVVSGSRGGSGSGSGSNSGSNSGSGSGSGSSSNSGTSSGSNSGTSSGSGNSATNCPNCRTPYDNQGICPKCGYNKGGAGSGYMPWYGEHVKTAGTLQPKGTSDDGDTFWATSGVKAIEFTCTNSGSALTTGFVCTTISLGSSIVRTGTATKVTNTKITVPIAASNTSVTIKVHTPNGSGGV